MTKHGNTSVEETVAHVRQVMGRGNPVGRDDLAGAAGDAQGHRALARIMVSDPDAPAHRPGRRRRRWTIVLAATLTLGALGAGADAAGVIPSGVVNAFGRAEDPNSDWSKLDMSKAKKVIEARNSRGVVVQLWMAPGLNGSECTYLRTVAHEDGSLECGQGGVLPKRATPGAGTDDPPLQATFGDLTEDELGVLGRAPVSTTQIRVTLQDGQRRVVPVRPDGFFMAFLDHRPGPRPTWTVPPEDPNEGFEHADIAAVDARGHVLAEIREYASSF
ncbi:hypothetical protein AGRA3207_003696 [Actinomadura graeca]|uniref:Uncharacterized protein n=1 Tax=Actinomadura graeca TaxID=2750812 RepID=A0ABX8QY81_9ACTN|nr:hypothetical protein [Actinomadura graeca]QXJ22657.1 hypothetical protein AGRA3207_003696 [Actinomadura graeca]